MPNVHLLPVVMNDCDQPVFVATDIKDGELSDFVRRPEDLLEIPQ
jgi:hypothetical protein